MDEILKEYRDFSRCYINNIIIFFEKLNEYLNYLLKVFSLFKQRKITLKPKKSFLGYFFITLLKRKIDGFGFTTTEEKLETIRNIALPTILGILEYYLGLINQLKSNVVYYIQIVKALSFRKTELFKSYFNKKNQNRKRYINKKLFFFIVLKRKSYNFL